jgi:hypothetical protein
MICSSRYNDRALLTCYSYVVEDGADICEIDRALMDAFDSSAMTFDRHVCGHTVDDNAYYVSSIRGLLPNLLDIAAMASSEDPSVCVNIMTRSYAELRATCQDLIVLPCAPYPGLEDIIAVINEHMLIPFGLPVVHAPTPLLK